MITHLITKMSVWVSGIKKPKSYFRSFARDYRLRSLIQSVDLGKGKLLDIGCGGGMISETLPYYYPKGALYGADVSKSAITYAKKIWQRKSSVLPHERQEIAI